MKLTNQMLAFSMAEELKEKNLISSYNVMEAAELIKNKLVQYRDKVELYKAKMTPEAAADLKSQHGLPRDDFVDKLYEKHEEEMQDSAAIAEKGYQEAYEIIMDLRDRMEQQSKEHEEEIKELMKTELDSTKKVEAAKSLIEEALKKPESELLQDLGRAGFPQDDEYSIHQGSPCDANLSIFYTNQYVENEKVLSPPYCPEPKKEVTYILEHTPVLQGTLFGTCYIHHPKTGDYAVQTFMVEESGKFHFTEIGDPKVRAISGDLNLDTGEITLVWNHPVEDAHLVVCYDYNYVENE